MSHATTRSYASPIRSIEGYVIILCNLPTHTRQDDILDLCYQHVTAAHLTCVKLGIDQVSGDCCGYALITVDTLQYADTLIRAVNETQIHGSAVTADYAFVQPTN